MDLKTYISDGQRRKALAQALGTSRQYLWQIANGWADRKAGPKLAQRIEEVTALLGPERVPKESLRPDLWNEAA